MYYRPSREAILKILRRKVTHVASHFEEFDHLVRSLGRDGLLGSDADQKLVDGEYHNRRRTDMQAPRQRPQSTRWQRTSPHPSCRT